MKRWRLALGVASACALAGCEGLLGIDGLQFVAGDAGPDATADVGASDARPGDTGSGDTGPMTDASDDADAGNDSADASDGACVVARSTVVLNDAIQVVSGQSHTCALRADGTVVCWGDNSLGQLGVSQGTTLGSTKPVVVQFPSPAPVIRRVASGVSTMYAVDANLQLWAWGANDSGELGNGTQDMLAHPAPALVDYADAGPMLVRAVGVTSGPSACAVDSTGALYCWGASGQGGISQGLLGPTLDDGSTWVDPDAGSLVPLRSQTVGTVAVPGSAPLLGGGNGSSAICYAPGDLEQHVICWGADGDELMDPDASGGGGGPGWNVNAGVSLSGVGTTFPLTDLQFGTMFACAIDSAGALECWGADPALDGGSSSTPSLTQVDGGFTALGIGYLTVCVAQGPGGQLLCRGYDVNGDLGLGGTGTLSDVVTTFGAVVGTDGGAITGVQSLASGAFLTMCAIETGPCGPSGGGTVVCWGDDGFGQTGSDAGFSIGAAGFISTTATPVVAP
ncbi:MAG TPA: hypothetical protein VF765_11495 [Polyangiaceae bacterium]